MKPAPFAYLAPGSLDEALEALGRYGEDAKVLAGGQSLMPLLNFRLARPAALVDLNSVAGLDGLAHDTRADELVAGAMVRQGDAERSPLVRRACPLAVAALKQVGHRAIRNRGTVGGSLAHADPAAELPLVLVLLDGRVRAVSRRGERWIAAGDLFVSYLTTALAPDEILVEARFATPRGTRTAWGFEEFSRRSGDFALAAAGTVLSTDGDGAIRDAAIAIAGGGPTPVRARDAERALMGQRPSDRLIEHAARLAVSACDVQGDMHGSAEYRRALIEVMVERALRRACGTAPATLRGSA
jgi:CO/xanthine dehydrogenase FAD-binding subunit